MYFRQKFYKFMYDFKRNSKFHIQSLRHICLHITIANSVWVTFTIFEIDAMKIFLKKSEITHTRNEI